MNAYTYYTTQTAPSFDCLITTLYTIRCEYKIKNTGFAAFLCYCSVKQNNNYQKKNLFKKISFSNLIYRGLLLPLSIVWAFCLMPTFVNRSWFFFVSFKRNLIHNMFKDIYYYGFGNFFKRAFLSFTNFSVFCLLNFILEVSIVFLIF